MLHPFSPTDPYPYHHMQSLPIGLGSSAVPQASPIHTSQALPPTLTLLLTRVRELMRWMWEGRRAQWKAGFLGPLAPEQLCQLLFKCHESWVSVASPPPKRAVPQLLPEAAVEGGAGGSVSNEPLSVNWNMLPLRRLLRRLSLTGQRAAEKWIPSPGGGGEQPAGSRGAGDCGGARPGLGGFSRGFPLIQDCTV